MGYQICFKLDILDNQVYWNFNPKLFCLSFINVMLYRKRLKHETCLRISPLNLNISQLSKRFIAKEIIYKLRWYIVLFIPRLPDIVQRCFCTPDGALDPTFQIKCTISLFLFNLMEKIIIKLITLFFEAPCTL